MPFIARKQHINAERSCDLRGVIIVPIKLDVTFQWHKENGNSS